LEEAYRRTAKKHGNMMSKWKEWEVNAQMKKNEKLLSKWE
jgi:hypothetical protein